MRVTNGTGVPLTALSVADELPAGFTFVNGSARLADEPVAPQIAGARAVYFVDTIDAGSTLTLSYAARVGPGALGTLARNRVQATAGGAFSNVATADVQVEDAAFSQEGIVVGKIFVDCNQNRFQDPGDVGIHGVRVFLEDGTWVISDSEGKYSFVGLRPATHVLRLDPITLPEAAEMTTLSNRNAGVADSQFVDLKRGELKRADFAEGSCNEDLLEQVKLRRSLGEVPRCRNRSARRSRFARSGSTVKRGPAQSARQRHPDDRRRHRTVRTAGEYSAQSCPRAAGNVARRPGRALGWRTCWPICHRSWRLSIWKTATRCRRARWTCASRAGPVRNLSCA